ncbi:MAG: tetratricopeptide repeat protein [Anaerolineae bacterium]
MSSEQAKLLRQQGIAAAKAGQKDQARDLLRQSLRLDPQNEAAWTWLMTVAKDARERAVYLQKLLEINPYSEMGLKALQSMGLTIDQLRALTTQTGQAAGQPVQKVTVQPNVPLPNPQRVANAQEAADEVVARFLTPPTAENIVWTPKKRSRAGERDQLVFRMQVFAGIVGALLVLGAIGVGVLMSTPEGQAVLLGASPTYSVTPSLTPSPTFGATPTPSQTPELTSTPSPTPPGELTPADLYRLPPTPTDIYPPIVAEFAIQRAAQAVLEGNTEDALPTLDSARQQLVGAIFNPAPVYYQAIALADTGRFDDALEVLEEAETELSNLPADQLRNSLLIHTGFAYVYLKMAEDAIARSRSGEASDYFDFVIERAETARDVDPRFVQPYLLLARAYQLQENYTLALNEIRSGLNVPELASDTNLLIAEGEIHLEQGDYDAALYQAYLALYVDPTLQAAHRLQIQAAMLKGDPGLAVIYAQQYIFYYPGSVDAYRLLGDARLAEGNDDLALAAYSQALEGSEDDPAYVNTLVSRAALYSQQRRFDLALNDLSSAVALSDSNPSIVVLRMYAAYYAGRYGTAGEDADELIGSDVVSDEEIKLMQARIIVDGAAEGDDSQLEAAINLLNEAGDVPSQPGVAAEYRARVQYRLESYEDALRSINAALDAGESGSRYLLLGQILEALEEYDSAARAYEWVLTWSSIYPYPFLPEAQDGLDRVLVAASRSED